MLKYQEIIEKLKIEQKLSLLADVGALAGVEIPGTDFKPLAQSSMEKINGEGEQKYPSFDAMANSWNVNLISCVSNALSKRARKNGVTLLETPSANVKTTPYSDGLSEDPYLAGTVAGICSSTGMRCGVKTVFNNPSLKALDVAYSDKELNEGALNEYFKKSYDVAFRYGVGAVKLHENKLSGSYKDVNKEWNETLEKKYPILKDCNSAHELMTLIREGKKYATKGSYIALKEALHKYLSLREAFEAGMISLTEIETECEVGGAISPEAIDEAVDRVIGFAVECSNMKSKEKVFLEEEKLALVAAEESIVLLKNAENVLPLRKRARVGIVGGLANSCAENGNVGISKYATELMKRKLLNYSGYAKGYDYKEARNDALIKEAVALASRSDVIIVVLGHDAKGKQAAQSNKNTKLPANQAVLVEALAKTNAKIVAVVGGDVYPDMSFDAQCSASLIAPISGSKSAAALFRVLMGTTNPSGRLAFTCYNGTDEHFATLRAYKDNDRNKVGTFYGYRQYDTAGIPVKYPFGHGLSYTQFAYSKINLTDRGVEFTVKNVGRCSGSEVVQVYAGKKNGALVRPRKELKAYFKMYLKPGQSKTVHFKIADLDLTVWDSKQKKFVCEQGTYQLYVGSSVKDIKATRSFYYGLQRLERTKEKYCEYLQTYTNIHHGGYTLEIPVRKKPKSNNGRIGAMIWLIIMLGVDLIYAYFSYVKWMPKHWAIYTAVGILNAVPLLLTIILNATYNTKINKEREISMKEKMKRREALNIDDLADEIPYEELFEEEFAAPVETKAEEKETAVVKAETDDKWVYNVPFDKDLPLTLIADEFYTFANERGVLVDKANIRKLISAFAASRLLIVKSSNEELFSKFIPIMNEYFGSVSTTDSFVGIEAEEESLLYRKNEFGEMELSNAGYLLTNATAERNRIRVMSLLDVKVDGLKACLAPIIRYIDQPLREVKIPVRLREGAPTEQYDIPEDMWLLITLASEERLLDVPKYLMEMASVVDLQLQEGMKPKTRIEIKQKAKEESSMEAQDLIVESSEEAPAEEIAEVASEPEEAVAEEAPAIAEEIQTESANVVEETADEVQAEEAVADASENEIIETVVETEKTPVKQLIYSQFKKLVENACRENQLDEVLWKRVDKLEQYVDGCNEFHIENKQWQRMEKFVSVYLALGGEPEEALDSVLAQQLMYSMLPCVAESKKPLDEKFTHTLENIFGEGHVDASVKIVRESKLDI